MQSSHPKNLNRLALSKQACSTVRNPSPHNLSCLCARLECELGSAVARCNCRKELGRKAPRMVTGFDIFWVIASSALSANVHLASIRTAAVDPCLVGRYVNWKIPNLNPGLCYPLQISFYLRHSLHHCTRCCLSFSSRLSCTRRHRPAVFAKISMVPAVSNQGFGNSLQPLTLPANKKKGEKAI